MAEKKVDTAYEYSKIAKERALWMVRPLFIVLMTAWVLYPETVSHELVEQNTLLGFILGTCFGIFVYRQELQNFLSVRRKGSRHVFNKTPEDYYFGKIKEVLFTKE